MLPASLSGGSIYRLIMSRNTGHPTIPVQMHKCWSKIYLAMYLVILCLLSFSILSSAVMAITTSTTVGNIPPAINDVSASDIYAASNEMRVNISVIARDNNSVDDIDLVRIYLTNKTNLKSSFIATTWLTQGSLNLDKTLDQTTALYNGTLSCPVCQRGDYYIEAQVFDKSGAMGNWLNYTNAKKAFRILEIVSYVNSSVNTTENIPTVINANIVNTTLEFVTPENSTGSLNINRSTLASSTPLSGPDPGIYLDIDVSGDLDTITWALIKVNYTDADIAALGIAESSLRLYWLDESSDNWIRLEGAGSPPWIFDAGVDTVNNVVWANVSHFSEYAVGGQTTPASDHNRASNSAAGGGWVSVENFSNIEIIEKYDRLIFKDIVTIYKFTNKKNPVLFINITGNINAGEINTAIEVLKDTSSIIMTPAPGFVYKNINAWVGTSSFAIEKNIKNAEIIFRVDKEWINEINPESIEMYRFESEWKKLPTIKISEDNEFEYYRVTTQKFSGFAISATTASPNIKYTFDAPPQITRVTSTNANEAIIVENSSEPEIVEASPGFDLDSVIFVIFITVLFIRKKVLIDKKF